jgi:hypothetical protein
MASVWVRFSAGFLAREGFSAEQFAPAYSARTPRELLSGASFPQREKVCCCSNVVGFPLEHVENPRKVCSAEKHASKSCSG